MSEKFDRYTDIISRLAGETVQCCPESWTGGVLSILTIGPRITYHLKNVDSVDKAVISEELRDLIDETFVRMRDGGDAWKAAELTWWQERGELSFNIDFTYEDAPVARRPWWKFGRD